MPDPRARVRLGRTALSVTRLGLGCAPLGNMYAALSDDEAAATVGAAWDAGLRWFDTAPLYGNGVSERRLGAALRQRPRGELVVASKVGWRLAPGADAESIFVDVPARRPTHDYSAAAVEESLAASLERLGLARLDVVHVHDPDEHEREAMEQALPRLARWRADGRIGAVGAGMNQAAMLARFVEREVVDCVLVAGRYSLLDQSALADLLPLAERRGVAVIVGGVFNSGLLADPRPGARYDYAPAPPAVLERASRVAALCARHDVPLRAAALQFATFHPAVSSVLVGARSAAEVADNARLFALDIPAALWRTLRDAGCIDRAAPLPA